MNKELAKTSATDSPKVSTREDSGVMTKQAAEILETIDRFMKLTPKGIASAFEELADMMPEIDKKRMLSAASASMMSLDRAGNIMPRVKGEARKPDAFQESCKQMSTYIKSNDFSSFFDHMGKQVYRGVTYYEIPQKIAKIVIGVCWFLKKCATTTLDFLAEPKKKFWEGIKYIGDGLKQLGNSLLKNIGRVFQGTAEKALGKSGKALDAETKKATDTLLGFAFGESKLVGV